MVDDGVEDESGGWREWPDGRYIIPSTTVTTTNNIGLKHGQARQTLAAASASPA